MTNRHKRNVYEITEPITIVFDCSMIRHAHALVRLRRSLTRIPVSFMKTTAFPGDKVVHRDELFTNLDLKRSFVSEKRDYLKHPEDSSESYNLKFHYRTYCYLYHYWSPEIISSARPRCIRAKNDALMGWSYCEKRRHEQKVLWNGSHENANVYLGDHLEDGRMFLRQTLAVFATANDFRISEETTLMSPCTQETATIDDSRASEKRVENSKLQKCCDLNRTNE
ncbi:hypothetical protein DICVIV_03422 [Dictyocaulus viviparus]|uniref:Uncharacterized protein n=1 Tax=Dictyocaulus viviparus TaxID=29172 RepID=A0A0D8Y748_DICVI|nr:hypothetical protein DICVIV_03422 [Dictyocaulus viviparus]